MLCRRRIGRAAHRRAERSGRSRGACARRALADARAKAGRVQVRAVDPAPMTQRSAASRCGRRATRRPSRPGAKRTAPTVSSSMSTGAAHLFGGEEKLLADLACGSTNFGLPARLAVADTPGSGLGAVALSSRPAARIIVIVPSGQEAQALAPLADRSLAAFARYLHDLAPARLQDRRRAHRQAARAVRRALSEPNCCSGSTRRSAASPSRSTSIVAPPVYHSLRYLLEPIFTQEAIVAVARRLMQDLAQALVRDDVGARALAALALPRRRRRGDDRHRPHPAEPRCGAYRAADRSQARARWRRRKTPVSASRRSGLRSPVPNAWRRGKTS